MWGSRSGARQIFREGDQKARRTTEEPVDAGKSAGKWESITSEMVNVTPNQAAVLMPHSNAANTTAIPATTMYLDAAAPAGTGPGIASTEPPRSRSRLQFATMTCE